MVNKVEEPIWFCSRMLINEKKLENHISDFSEQLLLILMKEFLDRSLIKQ